jgi:hypothetical protein
MIGNELFNFIQKMRTTDEDSSRAIHSFADKYVAQATAEQNRKNEVARKAAEDYEKFHEVPLGKKIADAIESVARPVFDSTVGQIPVVGEYLKYDKVKAAMESLGNTIGDKIAGLGFIGGMMEVNLENDKYLTNMKNQHLSKLIIKTLSNPKFIAYAIDNIPTNTTILDAVKMYIGRPKENRYRNKVDKSLEVLRGYGSHII